MLIAAADAERLGLADGVPVIVRSDHGELRGQRARRPDRAGNVQVHWPEGNALIGRDAALARGRVPDYNARVSVERASG